MWMRSLASASSSQLRPPTLRNSNAASPLVQAFARLRCCTVVILGKLYQDKQGDCYRSMLLGCGFFQAISAESAIVAGLRSGHAPRSTVVKKYCRWLLKKYGSSKLTGWPVLGSTKSPAEGTICLSHKSVSRHQSSSSPATIINGTASLR